MVKAGGPLSHLRVVDLTDKRGWLTGRILADLGATVVKVEPPGGDPDRVDRRAVPGMPSGGQNPAWLAFNRGKKSVTVDVARQAGRDLLMALIRRSDVVIESFPPGTMAAIGLGYDDLVSANPAVVLTSISPFGQTGPYAHWASADIVVGAMGGAVWPNGDPDRPPVRIGTDQYFLHASAEATLHTLAAVRHAAQTGQGQHVDVAAQLAAIRTLMTAATMPCTDGSVADRCTFGQPTPRQPYRRVYRCADGYVMISPKFGPGPLGIIQWLREAQAVPASLTDLTDEQLASPTVTEDLPWFADELSAALEAFLATRHKSILADEALARRLMLAPITNVADLVDDQHLAARGYFTEVKYEGAGVLATPWEWAKMTASPLVAASGTVAPGADNIEVWCGRAGLAESELARHRGTGLI